MPVPRNDERDRRIVAAYSAGITRVEIAAATGLTVRRISQIVALAGATMPHHEASRRHRPGYKPGRPRLLVPEADRWVYVKMRRLFGARYARDQLGLI